MNTCTIIQILTLLKNLKEILKLEKRGHSVFWGQSTYDIHM